MHIQRGTELKWINPGKSFQDEAHLSVGLHFSQLIVYGFQELATQRERKSALSAGYQKHFNPWQKEFCPYKSTNCNPFNHVFSCF